MTDRWILFATIAVASSLLLLLVGPLGTRFRLWPLGIGLAVTALGLLLGVTAVILGLLGAWLSGQRMAALAAIVVALAALSVPVVRVVSARGAPPIHDISTDLDDPPAFAAVLPLRTGSVSPADYDGPEAASQQRRAYPDLQPLAFNRPRGDVFAAADAVAREQGWNVVASDARAGRIEAIDTTFWFGFQDDVVIRLREDAGGTRVDIRSKSRVGRGDLGTNAERIRRYLDELHRRLN